jgi:hypothetical protein
MKSYKQFITESKKDIKSICDKYNIKNYIINEDGSIDVDGDVDFDRYNLIKLPLKFGKVTGDFKCSNNKLTSLEGAPKEVGDFYCSRNKLTSLEGCPKKVGYFYCGNNKLTSLEGLEIISGDLNCNNNIIINFRGIPEFFDGKFYCAFNPIFEIWNLFHDPISFTTDYRCIDWINEFDVIRGKTIVLDRLEEVFHQLEMKVPQNLKFKHYEII